MTKIEKMKNHVRLARKHIRAIEKLGYTVAVGHCELNVYDYSNVPENYEKTAIQKGKNPVFWCPEDQIVETIS